MTTHLDRLYDAIGWPHSRRLAALPSTAPEAIATLADMATAREQLRALLATTPPEKLTATEAARHLGVSRQRVADLAREEGITLAKYRRGQSGDELAGAVKAAERSAAQLRALMGEARRVLAALHRAESDAKRRRRRLP